MKVRIFSTLLALALVAFAPPHANAQLGRYSDPPRYNPGNVRITGGTISVPSLTAGATTGTAGNLRLNNTSTTKAVNLSNGSWAATAVPFLQPVDTGGMAFDIMSKGGPGNVWMDICSTDCAADSANYEALTLYKASSGNAHVSATALGTGTVRNLTFQLNGGKASVGTTNFGSLFNVEGSVSIGGTGYTTVAAPANGAIVQGKVGIGTVGPDTQTVIEVPGGGATTALTLRILGTTIGDNPSLDFALNNGNNTSNIRARIQSDFYAASSGALSFWTINTTLAEKMRLDKTGNLYPATAISNTSDLGIASTNVWRTAYLGTSLVMSTGASINLASKAAINTAPTIASGFCTSPSVSASNGTAAFALTIGSSCTGVSTGTITMPAATTGWVCHFSNTGDTSALTLQTGGSTTTVSVANYARSTAAALDWSAGLSVRAMCTGY